MEIEAAFGYMPNYPITLSSSVDHGGNIYSLQANYNYQYSSDNLGWSNSESFINQSDLSTSPQTSFYYQNQTLNSTTHSDEQQPIVIDNYAKGKRGRKKGCGKKSEKSKASTRRSSKRSDSSQPASPNVMKKRRLAANARERRRMNGLNVAFDR